jgi:hypothetical protein
MLNAHNFENIKNKTGRQPTMEELRVNKVVVTCKTCGREIDSHWYKRGYADYPEMNQCAKCFQGYEKRT